MKVLDAICLIQLEFVYPLHAKNQLEYLMKITANMLLDTNLFYINKTSNCLSFKISTNVDPNKLAGFYLTSISVFDQKNRSDSIECSIYVTRSCNQKSFILIKEDITVVMRNVDNFIE